MKFFDLKPMVRNYVANISGAKVDRLEKEYAGLQTKGKQIVENIKKYKSPKKIKELNSEFNQNAWNLANTSDKKEKAMKARTYARGGTALAGTSLLFGGEAVSRGSKKSGEELMQKTSGALDKAKVVFNKVVNKALHNTYIKNLTGKNYPKIEKLRNDIKFYESVIKGFRQRPRWIDPQATRDLDAKMIRWERNNIRRKKKVADAAENAIGNTRALTVLGLTTGAIAGNEIKETFKKS